MPLAPKTKIYVPKVHTLAHTDWMGIATEEHWNDPVSPALLGKYFELTDDPAQAEAAVCFIRQPNGAGFTLLGGYDVQDRKNGGSGYVPISLQYRPYTATQAREHSIAGGDPQENFIDRSYRGKTVTVRTIWTLCWIHGERWAISRSLYASR